MEVEHAPHRFPYNSAKTLLSRSGGMDYNDVFGGPPRRLSMQGVRGRHGFLETAIDEEVEEEDRVSTPVFGEEPTPRGRHPGGNFFDDIFGGNESYVSPRNRNRDRDWSNLFDSSPNSTIISPTTPKSEHFGTSVPAQSSLPAKVNKVEFPAFSSLNHGTYKMDMCMSALVSPRTSTTSSRFPSQAVRSLDENRNEALLFRQCSLPREACFRFEDPQNAVTSDEKETSPNLKKDRKSFDGFSIYKWASGKGIPKMSLLGRNSLKSKDKVDKCSSFNRRLESKPSIMRSFSACTEPEHLKMEPENKDSRSKDEEKESRNSVEFSVLGAKDITSGAMPNIKSKGRMSRAEIGIMEKIVKEGKMNDSLKYEVMPTLRSLLIAEADLKGMEVNKTTTQSKDQPDTSKNTNTNEVMGIDVDSKSSSQAAAAVDPEESPGKRVAAGKVNEFVQIFNQEADSRRKTDVHTQSRCHGWKATGADQKENVDENLKKDEAQCNQSKKIPTTNSDDLSAYQNAASSSESDSTTPVEHDESLEDNFMVKQLSNDIEEVTQDSDALEHSKAIDVKIQEWSVGKNGNIRSLLSTLQYVLWPGSGWNPVPLVELIEANAVKRAYQKALLRLHPDKLQQSSAASQHKYSAEKIFDILQEAWDHFNSLDAL